MDLQIAWILVNSGDNGIGSPASVTAVTIDAVKAKVSYAKAKGLLAGYNAFQLSNDDNWVLSQAGKEDGYLSPFRFL
ncbi:hypothetical protein REPUB_Repub18cG0152700 [Reevesia pubescens]